MDWFGCPGHIFNNSLWLVGVKSTGPRLAVCNTYRWSGRHLWRVCGDGYRLCPPKNEHSERNLIFTILSVTILSTVAMIAYPAIGAFFELDDLEMGVFIGGTIHDVAQVVGAGFSISDQTGEFATVVKLIRVAMLAPIVLAISLLTQMQLSDDHDLGKKPPIIPLFVVAFLVLAALNSIGFIPAFVSDF